MCCKPKSSEEIEFSNKNPSSEKVRKGKCERRNIGSGYVDDKEGKEIEKGFTRVDDATESKKQSLRCLNSRRIFLVPFV